MKQCKPNQTNPHSKAVHLGLWVSSAHCLAILQQGPNGHMLLTLNLQHLPRGALPAHYLTISALMRHLQVLFDTRPHSPALNHGYTAYRHPMSLSNKITFPTRLTTSILSRGRNEGAALPMTRCNGTGGRLPTYIRIDGQQ